MFGIFRSSLIVYPLVLAVVAGVAVVSPGYAFEWDPKAPATALQIPKDISGVVSPGAYQLQDRAVTGGARKRSVIATRLLWDPGQRLVVCFQTGTTLARQRVAKFAAEWTKYANIELDFGPEDQPRSCSGNDNEDIKIAFVKGSGHWSSIGRQSLKKSTSMNLDGMGNDELEENTNTRGNRRIVLHEFGHALGLQHEHASPKSICEDEIDFEAAYTFYELTHKWKKEQVDRNLRRLPQGTYLTTDYDQYSIMHYRFPREILKRGNDSPCAILPANELSTQDKEVIARLYPGRTAEPVTATDQPSDRKQPMVDPPPAAAMPKPAN